MSRNLRSLCPAVGLLFLLLTQIASCSEEQPSANPIRNAENNFYKKDFRSYERDAVQVAAENISGETLVFVVHGGTKDLQMAPYNVAKRLDSQGVPVAFLLASDHDNNIDTSHTSFYSNGKPRLGVLGFSNGDMNALETSLCEQAIISYEEGFSKKLQNGVMEACKNSKHWANN